MSLPRFYLSRRPSIFATDSLTWARSSACLLMSCRISVLLTFSCATSVSRRLTDLAIHASPPSAGSKSQLRSCSRFILGHAFHDCRLGPPPIVMAHATSDDLPYHSPTY